MSPLELQSTYEKVRKVIRSCVTMAQWEAARRYAQLFINQVPAYRSIQIGENLTQALAQRKQIIRLRYGTPSKLPRSNRQ